MKKKYQLRFNPETLDLNPPTRECKYCGEKTGPSGVCGICKIIHEELDDTIDIKIIKPKTIQKKLSDYGFVKTISKEEYE